MCGFNCLECPFPDCISDEKPTPAECELDAAIDFDIRKDHAKINGTSKYFKYNHSEKGKEAVKRYNSSEKGKSRFKKYYESEKGKANAKRQNEKRKLQRLQQKGAKDERQRMYKMHTLPDVSGKANTCTMCEI